MQVLKKTVVHFTLNNNYTSLKVIEISAIEQEIASHILSRYTIQLEITSDHTDVYKSLYIISTCSR